MKESNIFTKNIIGIIAIGIIKFIADAVICPAVDSVIVYTVTDWLYTGVFCFAAAIILSENGCIFPCLEKGGKLLSRSSVVRMIIAFLISSAITSSVVVRAVLVCFGENASASVALGVLEAFGWIVIYITMTVKNSNSPRIAGLLAVCASAIVFSVISQYISAVRLYALMQNADGTLLNYLLMITATDYISLGISCVAEILIMCSMAVAAHFFRRKNSI